MNKTDDEAYDVLIVGGGISGLGAALELKKLGRKVCVLEKDGRVGGRMTTDRIDGFAIDRGATIFGNEFRQMRAVVQELGLKDEVEGFDFSFNLRSQDSWFDMSRQRPDRVVFSGRLSPRAKLAMAWLGAQVVRRGRKLNHGLSPGVLDLDDESVAEFFRHPGGDEFLQKVLLPALNGPFGGALRTDSKIILFQVFWNILLNKTWAIKGGLDRIPEAMAREFPVLKDCIVKSVELGSECKVRACVGKEEKSLSAYGVIFALPGNLVPALCDGLPAEVAEALKTTGYSALTSAHVLLDKATETKATACGVDAEFDYGYEIELEHNRVGGLCPPGKGLASIYFWDEPNDLASQESDAEIEQRARGIVAKCFPECADAIRHVHILRWQEGIPHFPAGRMTRMAQLRREMKEWNLPLQFCGDYLDGISTEGALVTGQEAAHNMHRYLG